MLRRTKSIFDAEIIRPSRQSQEEIITLRDSQRLTSDLALDMMAHASAAPASSGRSVIYSSGQQFLLDPGSVLDLNKPLPSIQSVQSAESSAHLLKGSQSLGSDNQVVDKDQDGYLLAAAPTTQNLEKLREHQSAAEELQAQDLIRAHPSASPRSAFWGEESRWVFQLATLSALLAMKQVYTPGFHHTTSCCLAQSWLLKLKGNSTVGCAHCMAQQNLTHVKAVIAAPQAGYVMPKCSNFGRTQYCDAQRAWHATTNFGIPRLDMDCKRAGCSSAEPKTVWHAVSTMHGM